MPAYPTYDLPADFDALPHGKLNLRWEDGGGENVWVKKLPDGNVILDNSPLNDHYRYQDKVDPGTRTVLARRYPLRFVHTYDTVANDEEDTAIRKAIGEAARGAGADLRFFSKGWGWCLVPHDVDALKVADALRAVPQVLELGVPGEDGLIPIEEWVAEHGAVS